MALARAEKEDTTPLYPKDRTELRERSSVTSALAPTSAIQSQARRRERLWPPPPPRTGQESDERHPLKRLALELQRWGLTRRFGRRASGKGRPNPSALSVTKKEGCRTGAQPIPPFGVLIPD
jgi:hypothetical protein